MCSNFIELIFCFTRESEVQIFGFYAKITKSTEKATACQKTAAFEKICYNFISSAGLSVAWPIQNLGI